MGAVILGLAAYAWRLDSRTARYGAVEGTRSDAAACAGSAERALVLVTCNGRAYHPETRTVAVFVAPGAGVDGDS